MPKGYKIEDQVIVPVDSMVKVQLILNDKSSEEDDTMKFTTSTTKNTVHDELQ